MNKHVETWKEELLFLQEDTCSRSRLGEGQLFTATSLGLREYTVCFSPTLQMSVVLFLRFLVRSTPQGP